MSEERQKTEPLSPEFKTEFVSKTIRDLGDGSLVWDFNGETYTVIEWGDIRHRADELFVMIAEYIEGKASLERKSELESLMAPDMLEFKGRGFFHSPNQNKDVSEEIKRLEARFDAMSELMNTIIKVLREVLNRLDK